MSAPFHENRRQLFLTENYFDNMNALYKEGVARFVFALKNQENDAEDFNRLSWAIADYRYNHLSLHYTAGEPLDNLRNELEGVVAAYEQYQKYFGAYEERPNIALFRFQDICDYERCMQIIGLCFLLHREDLLPRIAKLQDPGYEAEDALYEDLLAYALDNRHDIEEWYHDNPATLLIEAMHASTDEEASAKLKAYCLAWYPAMQACPWHDGHLQMTDTDGHYFGYWAFEAGAVAFLLDIDDSSIDHMVYPKDLMSYARKLRNEGATSPDSTVGRLRGLPNEVIPKTGWWHSPAKPNEQYLHWFEAGQHFPDIHSTSYGSVGWGYDPDEQKESPKK